MGGRDGLNLQFCRVYTDESVMKKKEECAKVKLKDDIVNEKDSAV